MNIICLISIIIVAISFGLYFVPLFLIHFVYKEQNLKQKYNTSWALVTGGSSGIGLSVAKKLLDQKLNVVVVAKDDEYLIKTLAFLQEKYAAQVIIGIGVDFSSTNYQDYMMKVDQTCRNLDIGLIFCNAGYFMMEGFHNSNVEKKIQFVDCNALHYIHFTDYFYKKLLANKKRGAFIYTSSETSLSPVPFSTMYCSCKSFVRMFAASFSMEAKMNQIDVLAINPGAVDTNLFKDTPNLSVYKIVKALGQSPDQIALIIFKSLGRHCDVDTGVFSLLMHLTVRILGFSGISFLQSLLLPYFSDMKQFFYHRPTSKKNK